MAGKRLVRRYREPNQMFDLYEPEDQLTEIFVDGYVGVTTNPSITKIGLYSYDGQIEENGKQIEQRTLKYRLVMPTYVWIDMCIKQANSYKKEKGDILTIFDNLKETIKKELEEDDPKEK